METIHIAEMQSIEQLLLRITQSLEVIANNVDKGQRPDNSFLDDPPESEKPEPEQNCQSCKHARNEMFEMPCSECVRRIRTESYWEKAEPKLPKGMSRSTYEAGMDEKTASEGQ